MENSTGAPQGRFENPALLVVACIAILGAGFLVFDKIRQEEERGDLEMSQGMGKHKRHVRAVQPPAATTTQTAAAEKPSTEKTATDKDKKAKTAKR